MLRPEPIPDLLKAVNEASGKAFALWITSAPLWRFATSDNIATITVTPTPALHAQIVARTAPANPQTGGLRTSSASSADPERRRPLLRTSPLPPS